MQPRLRLLISGVLAAIVFGAGYCVVVAVPGAGDTTTNDYTSFYASDSRMTTAMILFFALIAGCVLMLWFFSELRAQMHDGVLVHLGFSAAIVGAVALPVGASIMGGPAGAQQGQGVDFVGVPIAAAFSQAGLGVMLGIGMVGFAVATLSMSLAARGTTLVPRWLVILGSVFGVLSIASYFWIPGFAFVAWVLITGITLGTRSEVSEAAAPALVAQGGRT